MKSVKLYQYFHIDFQYPGVSGVIFIPSACLLMIHSMFAMILQKKKIKKKKYKMVKSLIQNSNSTEKIQKINKNET